MEEVRSTDGSVITYERLGSGPPLVLVHGGLTNRNTNWFAVKGPFAEKFTVFAIDRRGRGATSATDGHSIADEFEDVAAVIGAVGEPAFVIGHSYGAQIALGATALVPDRVRKLVLYEPPLPGMTDEQLQTQEDYAARNDWEGFVSQFLGEIIMMPQQDLDALRATPFWKMLVDEAKATLGDFRAFKDYKFVPTNFATLTMPVLLLYGSKSPSRIYATDLLMDAIPQATKVELTGQGHDAMMVDPEQFIKKVTDFLLATHG